MKRKFKAQNAFQILFAIILNWTLWLRYLIPSNVKAADITNGLVIAFLIFYILVYKRIAKGRYLTIFIGFMLIVISSALSAFFLFGQSIVDGVIVLRSMFIQLAISIPLINLIKRGTMSRENVINTTVVSARIACWLYGIHYVLYEVVSFSLLNIAPAEWGRYGSPRFYFLLVIPSFLLFHGVAKIFEGKFKILYFSDILIVLFLMMQVCKMRMMTISTVIAVAIGLIVAKKMGFRKAGFIAFGIISVLIVLNLTDMGNDFLNLLFNGSSSVSELMIRSYGRMKHIQSFLMHPVFGLGYPHENCVESISEFGTYTSVTISGTEQKVYIGDNGIFDFLYIFGIAGIVWLVGLFVGFLKKSIVSIKVYNNTLYLMVVLGMIIDSYTELNWFFGGMLFIGIFIALMETLELGA